MKAKAGVLSLVHIQTGLQCETLSQKTKINGLVTEFKINICLIITCRCFLMFLGFFKCLEFFTFDLTFHLSLLYRM